MVEFVLVDAGALYVRNDVAVYDPGAVVDTGALMDAGALIDAGGSLRLEGVSNEVFEAQDDGSFESNELSLFQVAG